MYEAYRIMVTKDKFNPEIHNEEEFQHNLWPTRGGAK